MRLVNFHIKLSKLLLALCLILAAGQAFGAYKYVDVSSGSDANNGAIGTPWKSIEYAMEDGGMSYGDTLYLRAGTYDTTAGVWKTGTNNNIWTTWALGGTATNYFTISNYQGESVTIDIPSDTGAGNLSIFSGSGCFKFIGINWTNSTTKAACIVNLNENYLQDKLTFQDCTFDWNNADFHVINIANATNTYDPYILINRCKVKRVKSDRAFIRNIVHASRTTSIDIYASLFRSMGVVVSSNEGGNGLTTLMLINNTFDSLTASSTIVGFAANSTCGSYNNIFSLDSTYQYGLYIYNANPVNITGSNCVFYRAVTADPGTELESMATAWDEFFPLVKTNYWMNPNFTDKAGDDYTIASPSYISGRGYLPVMPATDINGEAWTGLDIGCYKNPSDTASFPTINNNTVAFVGDSIAQGAGSRMVSNGWVSVVGNGNLGAAIGASGVGSLRFLIDRAAITWGPQYIFIICGNNNFAGSGNVPSNITAGQAATSIKVALDKAAYWGITPIWLGTGGILGGDPTTKPLALETAVISAIGSTYDYDSWLKRMMFNSTWANAYNNAGNEGYYGATGLSGDIHPNTVGYDLICSITEDMKKLRKKYWVADTAVSVVGSTVPPATYRYPQTKTQADAIDALNGVKARQKGKWIYDDDDQIPKFYLIP